MSRQQPWHQVSPVQEWFVPGDNQEQWILNMSSEKRRTYLARHGWDNEHSINYRYNRDGFRGDEFVEHNCLVALGCSFTFGVGLREDQTWPWIVADRLQLACNNLAWGGASADRCWRMAEFWVPQLQPKLVVMLTPPGGRMELIVNDTNREADGFMAQQAHAENWNKIWMSVDENIRLNQVKNQLAVAMLCTAIDVPCLIYETAEFYTLLGDSADTARDFRHQGPAVHAAFADKVLYEFKAKMS